jgi:NhaP-type Na+/H+ and K+/H+ antiporter
MELIYGIHFGEKVGGYFAPCEREEAECIIDEMQSDDSIIAQMVNADFLSQWAEYMVVHYGCSIHIHYKFAGKLGGIALVLLYKEDKDQRMELFKSITKKHEDAEDQLNELLDEGLDLEDIFDLAMSVG